jgi:hypothetical protein
MTGRKFLRRSASRATFVSPPSDGGAPLVDPNAAHQNVYVPSIAAEAEPVNEAAPRR